MMVRHALWWWLPSVALSCTEVVLVDNCTGNVVVSGRTLSFPTALSPDIVWAPEGAKAKLLNIAPGAVPTFGQDLDVTISSVCTSLAKPELRRWYPKDPIIASSAWGMCVDGLNAKGLSAAVLYQKESLKLPSYDPASSKKTAINFLDFPRFALSRFADIPELEAYIQKELQVVWNTEYDAFGHMMSAGAANVPPFHFVFHDSEGRTLVVQFREGLMEVLPNPLGVFTNEPLLQEQYEHYNQWKKAMEENPWGVYPSIHKPDEGKGPFGSKGTFWPLPGDYSGSSRFTRLAMAKEAAMAACWSTRSIVPGDDSEPLSPAYLEPGMASHNTALLTVLQLQNTVYLPRGVGDSGLMGGTPPEFTPTSSLRDHNATTYYYRTGNNPTFKAIDLRRVNWAGLSGRIFSEVLTPARQQWYEDASGTVDLRV